jgi:hypothetical protein
VVAAHVGQLLVRRELIDQCRQLARSAGQRKHGGRDPCAPELGEALALCLHRAKQKDLADERLRRELERTLAIASVPRFEDWLDLVTEAEPAEELGVDSTVAYATKIRLEVLTQ